MVDEQLTRTLRVAFTKRGLLEYVNPAASDEEFPPDFAAALENLRVLGGDWSTRPGMALWQPGSSNLPGTGTVTWLSSYYQSTGSIYRLLVRGGVLYTQTGSGAFARATTQINTTLNGLHSSGVTTLTVNSATGIYPYGFLVLNHGGGSQEVVQVASNYTIGSTTVPLVAATASSHADATTVYGALNPTPTYGQCQGTTLRDYAYITDRAGPLLRWDPTNGLVIVRQPTTPTNAPSTRTRPWAILEPWTRSDGTDSGSHTAPFGWQLGTYGGSSFTADGETTFTLAAAASTDPDLPSPWTGGTVPSSAKLTVTSSATRRKAAVRPAPTAAPWTPNSHFIGLWVVCDYTKQLWALEIGINAPGEFVFPYAPSDTNTSFGVFAPIGDLASFSYLQFRCLLQPAANRHAWLGPIILPGNLDGQYQWRYSYFNSATTGTNPLAESAPSPATPLIDCSATQQTGTQDPKAFSKSCELTFDSNQGNTPGTTKIRVYQTGGLPELTIDQNGNPVYSLVATAGDISSHVRGSLKYDGTVAANAIGYSSIIVTTGQGGANLSAGDWIVVDRNVATKQELLQVDSVSINSPSGYDTIFTKDLGYAFTDLAMHASTTGKVKSTLAPFTSSDLNKDLIVPSGVTGWAAGRYTIGAIDGATPPYVTLYQNGVATSPASAGATGGTGTLYNGCLYAHASSVSSGSGATVGPAWVANVANDAVDVTQQLEEERFGPPVGCHWIGVAPDGRLWLARSLAAPDPSTASHALLGGTRALTVYVSNLPTILHQNDQEVFPSGIAPQAVQSLLQGWTFDVSGDGCGDAVIWAGFYRGLYTVITSRSVYRVHALAQTDWNAGTVRRVVHNTGAVAGETVKELSDGLYWVSQNGAGPRVVRWNGERLDDQFAFQRVATTLGNAPQGYWGQWFAVIYSGPYGQVYRLCMTPSGKTLNTKWLNYTPAGDCWESDVYYDGSAVAQPFSVATVFDGPGDTYQLYAAHPTSGNAFQMETGSTDNSQPIRVTLTTKRHSLALDLKFQHRFVDSVYQPEMYFLRLAGVTDTASVVLSMGGSEYGETSETDSITLNGSGDEELKTRTNFGTVRGRWLQFSYTGAFSNRPSLREITAAVQEIRPNRVSS